MGNAALIVNCCRLIRREGVEVLHYPLPFLLPGSLISLPELIYASVCQSVCVFKQVYVDMNELMGGGDVELWYLLWW